MPVIFMSQTARHLGSGCVRAWRRRWTRRRRTGRVGVAAGMTLIELIIACSILMVLTSAAMPIMRYTIVHKREEELRYDLRQMRDAIDRYKDLADRNLIRIEVG